MDIYLIILLVILGLAAGLIFWVYKLFRLYKSGRKKSFAVQVSVLIALTIFVTWQLQIFPLSKNFYIKEQTTRLSGKEFWSWEEFDYDKWGVRGEGYTLYIYKFNQATSEYFMKPDSTFFSNFPSQDFADIKWTPTPVNARHADILTFATPEYAGWSGEIVRRQSFIREIANRKGSYYAYRQRGGTDFYIISPEDRLVILINHNM
ncbi:MAG: hypothetical protein C0424_04850 [Sphingobacteriaceae bacterium]|nr:hypothetical protein [Sphingobacteriaceae bacterium]